jgi:hypothetical protein
LLSKKATCLLLSGRAGRRTMLRLASVELAPVRALRANQPDSRYY